MRKANLPYLMQCKFPFSSIDNHFSSFNLLACQNSLKLNTEVSPYNLRKI